MENRTEQIPAGSRQIASDLSVNRQQLEQLFNRCYDFMLLPWSYGPGLEHSAFSVYLQSLIQNKTHNFMKDSLQDLVAHTVGTAETITPDDIIRFFSRNGVSAQSAKLVGNFTDAVRDMLDGCIVIFFQGWEQAISYRASKLETRQVTEPVNEPTVQGPREGTVEHLETNIGMLRSRVRSARFKIESIAAGPDTRTTIVYGYLEGAVDPDTLTEFQSRIAAVREENVLDTSYVEGLIEDSSYSPFPQFRYTERTDTAAAALLDGKILVLSQGSPTILICPGLFSEFFASSEDYYQRTVYSSMIRFLRMGAFLMALTTPSIYIAFSTFHPELLPTVLLLAILNTREGIPFPAFVEALIMEFFFELLREAGIRLPKPVGSAVSIVGALVIGQAAVQAKIASPIMVIVVAATGIASFAIPQYTIAVSLRILRFPLMICAATLGGFGLMIGSLLILLHLMCLRSLGQPYVSPFAPLDIWQLRDVLVRAPIGLLLRSPRNRHKHNMPRS